VKTILIIEDERTIRTNILKILEFKGFQVLGAESGEEGLQLAREYLPDLILCDVMMPGCDGYQVLEVLRDEPETAEIPFIFLTAKSDLADVRRGMNLGADDYIPKPFSSEDLVAAVRIRLSKKATLTQPYVDQMKQAARTLGQTAYTDLLTNLPNRIGLLQQLLQALTQAPDQRLAVICINLDRFSQVNATRGYMTGDLLLRAVAERLKASLETCHILSRLAGDQFVVVLANLEKPEDLLDWVDCINASLSEPYTLDGLDLEQPVSLGIALYPDHGDRPESLIVYAETALRWGRAHAPYNYQVYTPEIDAEERERKRLSQDLKASNQTAEFFLLYQPQVNLITHRIIGIESFLRWRHPKLGVILPNKFISLAEDAGMVDVLTEWCLRTACKQAAQFQSLSLVPISVAVNLSAQQFQRPNLIYTVQKVLEETGLDPQLLNLELTEQSLSGEHISIRQVLLGLREIGVKITIDDFGMGYSSLKYLGQFPIDALKVDRFFIQQIEDEHYAAVVSSIIAIAQTLRLKVIAEGVETEAQLAVLRKYGCHAMQGHYHSFPLDAVAIAEMLREANS
jgi:diguanylate cyclase